MWGPVCVIDKRQGLQTAVQADAVVQKCDAAMRLILAKSVYIFCTSFFFILFSNLQLPFLFPHISFYFIPTLRHLCDYNLPSLCPNGNLCTVLFFNPSFS